MNPDIFENGDFFIRLSLPSTRQRAFSSAVFRKRSPEWSVFENVGLWFCVDE